MLEQVRIMGSTKRRIMKLLFSDSLVVQSAQNQLYIFTTEYHKTFALHICGIERFVIKSAWINKKRNQFEVHLASEKETT